MPGCPWHPGRLPGQDDHWILKAYGHSARLTSRRIPKGGEGAPGRGNSTHGCSEASICRPSGEPRVMGGAAVQDRGRRAHRGAWRGQPLIHPVGSTRKQRDQRWGESREGPGWCPSCPCLGVWAVTTGRSVEENEDAILFSSFRSVPLRHAHLQKLITKLLYVPAFFFLIRN